jgi:plastocyanin
MAAQTRGEEARGTQACPVPAAPAVPDPTPVSFPQPSLSCLQVTAREFSLTPSRATLPAGVTRIELVNLGEDPHDLRARPADGGSDRFAFRSVAAGGRHAENVDLGPGRWTFFCALPGHEVLGMRATVTVS